MNIRTFFRRAATKLGVAVVVVLGGVTVYVAQPDDQAPTHSTYQPRSGYVHPSVALPPAACLALASPRACDELLDGDPTVVDVDEVTPALWTALPPTEKARYALCALRGVAGPHRSPDGAWSLSPVVESWTCQQDGVDAVLTLHVHAEAARLLRQEARRATPDNPVERRHHAYVTFLVSRLTRSADLTPTRAALRASHTWAGVPQRDEPGAGSLGALDGGP